MKVHFLRVVIIHQHWREDGCGQGVVVEDGGAGKTAVQMLEMCERQRTHQASQANPSLSHSPHSFILSATLAPVLLHLPQLLLLLFFLLLLLLLLRFFLLFFTLTAH